VNEAHDTVHDVFKETRKANAALNLLNNGITQLRLDIAHQNQSSEILGPIKMMVDSAVEAVVEQIETRLIISGKIAAEGGPNLSCQLPQSLIVEKSRSTPNHRSVRRAQRFHIKCFLPWRPCNSLDIGYPV
jgi:hypothetical protein